MMRNSRPDWVVFLLLTCAVLSGAERPAPQNANSDANYRGLRDAVPTESYAVENIQLKRDVGEITLKQGTVTFIPAVLGKQALAVFNGPGEFRLKPAVPMEAAYLKSVTGSEAVADSFGKLVLCITDGTAEEIKAQAKAVALDPGAKGVLEDFRGRVRDRRQTPRSMVEALLRNDEMDNVEAELLADLYNPARPGQFRAYIFGKKYGDLRFFVRPFGALPELPSPDEVALIHLDPGGSEEGILYLAHRADEYQAGTASSTEDKRSAAAEHYRISTTIEGNEDLAAEATVRIRSVSEGNRVIRFGLLPDLRVSAVHAGKEPIPFIQEEKKKDGSFYVLLPRPLKRDEKIELTIAYAGEKVVENAGGGTFSIGARTSWYPSLNAFKDQATYDLTFRVPKRYMLVSVGSPVKEWKDGNYAASHWVSEAPLAVAGFNYGEFKKKTTTDTATNYVIEGYATSELPDYLRSIPVLESATPSALIDRTLAETSASVRIFEDWFGGCPFGRIALTQQPEFDFGQSWPGLVYLPMSAYLDATQRWQLMGIQNQFTDFIQEVTAHEVSHQWWGHMVGWASFRDQWLSEGFADFSAGIFLQFTEKSRDRYVRYLEQSRKSILEKNQFGRSPNEAGPLWMGLRLSTFKNPGAYNQLVYPKGGYVLHMLRMMMWEPKTGDLKFKAMMRDFVQSHLHKPASTESFMAVAGKHMLPKMDVEGNGRLDWFFRQWVYGTDIPVYKLEHQVQPEGDKFVLTAKVSQSGVPDGFVGMPALYVDLDGQQWLRLGTVTLAGTASNDQIRVALPKKPKRVLLNAYFDVLSRDK